MVFVLPIPTPSIFIISLPIWIISDPKKDVIPLNLITLSTDWTLSASTVVTAVDTTGDWITLSIATTTLAFWFVAINLWEVPIPTLSRSTTTGIDLSAFSALVAILIKLSSTFTAYKFSSGRNVVLEVPTKLAVAIPMADEAVPTWLYLIFSPLTKKWFGILIELVVTFTTSLLLPKKYLSKIFSFSWVSSNALLISDSVPKYSPIESLIDAFVKDIWDAKSTSSFTDNAFMYTLTTVLILAFGVNTSDTVPAAETLDPKVPRPDAVSIFAYSVI